MEIVDAQSYCTMFQMGIKTIRDCEYHGITEGFEGVEIIIYWRKSTRRRL